jgi:hypothetical protein
MTIINDDSRVVNKLEASLTDNARVIIYNHHMFIVQAPESCSALASLINIRLGWKCSELFGFDMSHKVDNIDYWGQCYQAFFLRH